MMPCNQNFFKKIIISVGKISLFASLNNKPNIVNKVKKVNSHTRANKANKANKSKKNKQKAYTLIELLAVLLLVAIVCVASDATTFCYKQYYSYRSDYVVRKISNLINFSKNIAIINQRDVSLCAADIEYEADIPDNDTKMNFTCTYDWHSPIVIFYTTDKEIILIEQQLIHTKENIKLNMFSRQPILKLDKLGNTSNINGTIYYSNLYYNKSIILNKIGRLKNV